MKNLGIVLLSFERHFDVTGPHIRFFSKRSVSTCLSEAGFEPLEWNGVGRVWPLYKSLFMVSRKVTEAARQSEIRI